jgi:hypothetical protein
MKNDDENCILIWGHAKYKTLVPYNPSSNVPIMYTDFSLHAHRAFATTFEALKANFFLR